MSKTIKPKATTPKRKTAPVANVRINPTPDMSQSERDRLEKANDTVESLEPYRFRTGWEARFYFLATRDPIQFKHLHRRVINSGLSWEEMVDKELGSFPDKGI